MNIAPFFELYRIRLHAMQETYKRPLYDQIDWESRLIVIAGTSGVGKTTLLLQRLKEQYQQSDAALYITGDSVLLHAPGLFQLAWEFEKTGGELLVIDEIHTYRNWQQELKNIFDSFPKLHLIVSGSSSLDIVRGQHDLSRRAVLYRMQGLSLREFMILSGESTDPVFDPIPLQTILARAHSTSADIVHALEKGKRKILKVFRQYLQFGYYPYILEGEKTYALKLSNAVAKVLYEDIPSFASLGSEATPSLQKLLTLIAGSAPFRPTITNISSDLGIAKDTVYSYLDALEHAGLVSFMHRGKTGSTRARKPYKILLENTNLLFLLGTKQCADRAGAMRETFALSQLYQRHNVRASPQADMLIDEKYTLEIGGQNKSGSTLKGLKDAYILRDGIEYGSPGIVPLWLLGFSY